MIYLKRRNNQQAENFSVWSRIVDLYSGAKKAKERIAGKNFTDEEVLAGMPFEHYGEDVFTSPSVANRAAKSYEKVAKNYKTSKNFKEADLLYHMADKIKTGGLAYPTSAQALGANNLKLLSTYARKHGIKIPSQKSPVSTFEIYKERRPLSLKFEDFVHNNKKGLMIGGATATGVGAYMASGDPSYSDYYSQTTSNNDYPEVIDYTNPNWKNVKKTPVESVKESQPSDKTGKTSSDASAKGSQPKAQMTSE